MSRRARSIRLSPEEEEMFIQCAIEEGFDTLSEWLRYAARLRVLEVEKREEVFTSRQILNVLDD